MDMHFITKLFCCTWIYFLKFLFHFDFRVIFVKVFVADNLTMDLNTTFEEMQSFALDWKWESTYNF